MKLLFGADTGDMVTLALALPLGGDKTPPAEFRIFPLGDYRTSKGTFVFDDACAKQVLAAWKSHGVDLPLDYEHAMVEPVSLDPAEAGKAAGWYGLELRGDGLYAVNVKWTPRAAEFLRAGEYRYVSPAFLYDKDKRITRLVNVALTNIPATIHQQPLVAAKQTDANAPEEKNMAKEITKLGRHINAKSKDAGLSHEQLAEKCDMTPEELDELKHSEELTKSHRAKLKALAQHIKTPVAHLRATADGEDPDGDEGSAQASAAIEGLMTLTGKSTPVEALAAVSALKGASEQVATLSQKVAQLEAANIEREVTQLVNEATKSGRFLPAQRAVMLELGKNNLATLKALVAATPENSVGPHVGEHRAPAQDGAAQTLVTLTDDDRKAARSMGVTPEKFLEHKAKVFPARPAQ